jgi:hypoxanthine phosphoribosyltransferase
VGSPSAEPRLHTLHGATEVAARIAALGAQIAADCRSRAPVLVVIAEGARRFAAALERELRERGLEPRLLEVRARRTRGGTQLGEVSLGEIDTAVLSGREVLIVDDIADEGATLRAVWERARAARPASLRAAVLVSRRARRKLELRLDYVGFEIGDGWVVGWGMDLDGAYRELDQLAIVEPP